MNRNYAVVVLFVMTSMVYAEKTPAKILEDKLRRDYEEGLKKVVAKDFKRLEDALKYAARREIEMFQSCMKGKDIEGQGLCKMYNDKAEERKENLNVLTRAKDNPSGFGKKVLRAMIVDEQDPHLLPPIQNPHEAEYDYRKDNSKHLAPGDLSRGEVLIELQKDLVQFQNDFVYKASKALAPDLNQRSRAAMEVKRIVGIPEPKGFWEKGFEKLKTKFFGWKPDRDYADYVEQLIGTPRKPYGDYPLDK